MQFEELLEAPDKVLFDLKYFLGMNVGELVGKVRTGHVFDGSHALTLTNPCFALARS